MAEPPQKRTPIRNSGSTEIPSLRPTVYAILSGRGFDEAGCVRGPSFARMLVRD